MPESFATSASALSAAPHVLSPLPSGLSYPAAIYPSMNLLIIGTVWSSFLVPITVALFFFSTPATRRQPAFIMNVFAILFGLVEGAINMYNQTRALLGIPVHPNFDTVFASMTILVPNFAELVLLFRVVAVYPIRSLSWRRCIMIYAPVAIFKVARFTNVALFIAKWVQLKKNTVNPLETGQEAWSLPNAKIEWFVQLFDTMYISSLFLARLQQRNEAIEPLSLLSPPTLRQSISSRLRTLFWIAVSNFVIPVLLNLAQLIFIFRDVEFLHGTYIFIVNNYVQIIGVLLATIWSTGTQRYRRSELDDDGLGHLTIRQASVLTSVTPSTTNVQLSMRSEERLHVAKEV
ncbi:hypothetical protein BC628DRAFT_1330172 [Trametes gibbosa]|nr:hypothetical protein BC628DRAFT_1330172 [Trametes gibbosa]